MHQESTGAVSQEADVQAIDNLRELNSRIRKELAKVIIGQDKVIEQMLTCIFARGHALLMGVPGLAKTLLVHSLADLMSMSFSRIQFTPDLMPSDITGTEILQETEKAGRRAFEFVKGPIFANIVLADEINRTPPKTQAALLQAMQEQKVNAGKHSFKLDPPFFVLATQNPIEQEGTYPLPEAQLDRFMFNVWLDYPKLQDELLVVKNTTSSYKASLKKVLTAEEIIYFQELVRRIPVADNVLEFAVKLAAKTRPNTEHAAEISNKYLSWGAGPRASQFLVIGAKCHAMIKGKYSPDIEDVKAVANAILRHRIVRNYKAEAEGVSMDKIIGELLGK